MKSVTENIREFSASLSASLEQLVLDYSQVRRWNTPGRGIIDFRGDFRWEKLDDAGRQLQAHLLENFRQYMDILRVLLCEQPNETHRRFEESERILLRVIQQDQSTWKQSTQDALTEAVEALEDMTSLVDWLYSETEDAVLVPDTNALLFNPNLSDWRFSEFGKFTLELNPIVLGELDHLKVNHNNPEIRERSERIIRQIKEYRRRGRLADGVPLSSKVSRLTATAKEPDLTKSLPWLDSTSQDDRLLASTIETMRKYPRLIVALVTRDINLQNKCEFASVAYLEPPDSEKL